MHYAAEPPACLQLKDPLLLHSLLLSTATTSLVQMEFGNPTGRDRWQSPCYRQDRLPYHKISYLRIYVID
jgi:hypothetical protein